MPDLPDLRDFVRVEPLPRKATFLDEARDPSVIVSRALVVAGDEDSPAVAVVVDLVDHPKGMHRAFGRAAGRRGQLPGVSAAGADRRVVRLSWRSGPAPARRAPASPSRPRRPAVRRPDPGTRRAARQ